jgi:hypothetical protein
MIEPGKVYWIIMDKARFQVRALRPSVLTGWWHCETVTDGSPIVVPQAALVEDEPTS